MAGSLVPLGLKSAFYLVVLPLIIAVVYLLYLARQVSAQLKSETGIRDRKRRISSIPPGARRPVSLPRDVSDDDDDDGSAWVLAYERVVSKPTRLPGLLPGGSGGAGDLSFLLTRYVRATMAAFSWTPQAFVLWASVGDGRLRRTFGADVIRRLAFDEGDRVNGFWRVVYRGGGGLAGAQRVEMALDAPPTYRGPLVRGVVVAGIEGQDDGSVVFVNETWMWRQQGEAPVLLEGRVGRWLHVLLSGWLVMKGVSALQANMSVR